MSLNKVNLVGRSGRDPEVKYFESGSVVCKFTVAVNRSSSNRDEPPDWFDVEAWGKTAEIAANYVKKGSLVGVSGSLKFDRWTDRTSGDERQKSVILIDRLDLLTSRKDSEAASSSGGYDDDF